MSQPNSFRLDRVSIVDIVGSDANAIAHNLTTNEIKTLAAGEGCETFVTNVRGKALGHVMLFRLPDRLRMIGAAGQSHSIAEHFDRYTIREVAEPSIRDDEFVAFALTPEAAASLVPVSPSDDADETVRIESRTIQCNDDSVDAYDVPWVGKGSLVLLSPVDTSDRVAGWLDQRGLSPGDEEAFHVERTRSGFPWYGIDLDDSNLPQEADRDRFAVSFTKGCYLGQETVARLDALGQVQKKLVSWRLDGAVPSPGSKLDADGKTVGRLTSVAPLAKDQAIALGFARRSHFDAGAMASGTDSESGKSFRAAVVD